MKFGLGLVVFENGTILQIGNFNGEFQVIGLET